MKIGTSKGQSPIRKNNTVTTNNAGGKAFLASDPLTRLIGSVGSYLGNEPTFYADKVVKRKGQYNRGILDQRGEDIVDAVIQACTSGDPEDVLRLAYWVREELNLRTVSAIILAVAARVTRSIPDNPIVRYTPKICRRPDDLLQVHAVYTSLFGSKHPKKNYMHCKLPGCLQKGIVYALASYSEYSLLKYNQTRRHPSFKDLLKSVSRPLVPEAKREGGFPLKKGLYEFLMDGEITENATPMLRARKHFSEANVRTYPIPDLKDLAIKGGLTWEVISSKFGGVTGKRKAEVWGLAAEVMPYMAKLRNLRNLVESGVPQEVLEKVCKEISDPANVARGRQLPFRYYSALKAFSPERITWNKPNLRFDTVPPVVRDCLYDALDASAVNLPKFTGNTALLIDVSGSMSSPVSDKSTISCVEMAAVLAAVLLKNNPHCQVALFSDRAKLISLYGKDTVMTNARKIVESIYGGGTNWSSGMELLRKSSTKFSRVITLSDMQAYGGYNALNVSDSTLGQFRKAHPGAFCHFVNLQGYQESLSPVQGDDRTTQTGSFSEKFVNVLFDYESRILGGASSNWSSPTMLDIRARFTVPVGSNKEAVLEKVEA